MTEPHPVGLFRWVCACGRQHAEAMEAYKDALSELHGRKRVKEHDANVEKEQQWVDEVLRHIDD